MPTRSYGLSPRAEADLEDIWLYTFQNWSLEQADSYQRDLVTTFEDLAAGTKRGRTTDIRPHYLKYPVGSHMVYFRDTGAQIEIMRILHQSQDVMLNL